MAEVRFLGAIRQVAGKSSFGVDAGTVEQLLQALKKIMAPAFREFLFEGENLRPNIEVLVNERNITCLDGLETALAPFDQVTLSVKGSRGLSNS
ncbi:MAG: molybdopterin synthase sulfur carrier subunit [Candidatus Methylomirabilota bacterium]|nr:MAG: molybdopterin synthase sulfur carrier subunit [candidate division NC10 bacterium]